MTASTSRGPNEWADSMRRSVPYRGQRGLDLVILVLTAPFAAALGALVAVAIRLDSKGKVFFFQERVGLNGRPFTIWKFRTMRHAADPTLRLPNAGNITDVGRVLRRLSIDELPQLVNVARGEMSIVGPRPTLAYQVERYDERQRHRLDVRPGLTGLAQIRGRNSLSWQERIELDLEYVATQSLTTDLAIVARTWRVLFVGQGVEGHRAEDPFVETDGVH